MNDESTLMVLDQNLGEQMDAIFREDLRYSDEILLDPFRRRSWLQRVSERSANLFTRLL